MFVPMLHTVATRIFTATARVLLQKRRPMLSALSSTEPRTHCRAVLILSSRRQSCTRMHAHAPVTVTVCSDMCTGIISFHALRHITESSYNSSQINQRAGAAASLEWPRIVADNGWGMGRELPPTQHRCWITLTSLEVESKCFTGRTDSDPWALYQPGENPLVHGLNAKSA